jgi:hypothetical protein
MSESEDNYSLCK